MECSVPKVTSASCKICVYMWNNCPCHHRHVMLKKNVELSVYSVSLIISVLIRSTTVNHKNVITKNRIKIKQFTYVYICLKEQTQQIQFQIWVSLLGNTSMEIPINSQTYTCTFSLRHFSVWECYGLRKLLKLLI